MDSDIRSRGKQVSLEQLKSLLEFLRVHRDLAKGTIRGRRGNLQTQKVWKQCAKVLNDKQNGATKDGKGWSKYWCDWKYRVRRRALELKVAQDNDTAPPEGVYPLNEMEENLMSIIGEQTIEDIVIKKDPLVDEGSDEDQLVSDVMDTRKKRKRKYDDMTTQGSKYPHLETEEDSYAEEDAGPSSPVDDHTNGEQVEDKTSLEFLRIEEQKLENTQRIAVSMEGIRTEMSRIGDILLQIRDVLVNNRNI